MLKNWKLKNDFSVAVTFCLLLGAFALTITAIGFRPKEVKEFFMNWLTLRGAALLLNVIIFALLAPAACRLRKQGFCSSHTLGIFISITLLFFTDLVCELVFKFHAISIWLLRVEYFAIVIWGMKEYKSFLKWILENLNQILLEKIIYKIIFGFIVFFLFREILHHYFTRPDKPFEDEIHWWFTGAKEFMNLGLAAGIKNHWYGDYTPAIPWCISIAPRLIGAHKEIFLLGFAAIPVLFFLFFSFEVLGTSKAFLSILCLIFFMFEISRDFLFHVAASLYGGALNALLITCILYEINFLIRKNKMPDSKKLISLGILVGFCRLTKPPLSFLIWYAAIVFISYWLIRFRKNLKKSVSSLFYFVIFSSLPFLIWKFYLQTIGKKPTYQVKVSEFTENGINLSVPLGMIGGLFNRGTPQSAYAWALCISLILSCWLHAWRTLKLQLILLLIYWGFVFGLYATVWQHGDFNSAGRYLSHAAVSCVLMLSFAFQENKEMTKGYSSK